MIRIQRIILLICCFLLVAPPVISGGFLAGTLIQTINGFIPVEQLEVGDDIVCFDQDNTVYTTSPITRISTKKVPHYIKVSTEDGVHISTAPDQQFYLAPKKQWVEAQHLTPNHILQAYAKEKVYIQSIAKVTIPVDVYRITVATHHTLCVSKQGIVAHNFFPAIGFGIWIAFGASAIEWGTALTAGAGILGSIAGFTAAQHYTNKKHTLSLAPTVQSATSIAGSPAPQGPKKRNDETTEHPHGLYEDAGYHHQNSNGIKSPSPQNGQRALDNSIQIKTTSSARVGISNGEIVVLNQTSSGVFHGHVRTWGELLNQGQATQAIRNALIQNGLVNHAGKILKSILL